MERDSPGTHQRTLFLRPARRLADRGLRNHAGRIQIPDHDRRRQDDSGGHGTRRQGGHRGDRVELRLRDAARRPLPQGAAGQDMRWARASFERRMRRSGEGVRPRGPAQRVPLPPQRAQQHSGAGVQLHARSPRPVSQANAAAAPDPVTAYRTLAVPSPLALPETVEVAILPGRYGCVFGSDGEYRFGPAAGLEFAELHSLPGLQHDPLDIMSLEHRVLHASDLDGHDVAFAGDYRHVLLPRAVAGVRSHLLHGLAAAYHLDAATFHVGNHIAAMAADIELYFHNSRFLIGSPVKLQFFADYRHGHKGNFVEATAYHATDSRHNQNRRRRQETSLPGFRTDADIVLKETV